MVVHFFLSLATKIYTTTNTSSSSSMLFHSSSSALQICSVLPTFFFWVVPLLLLRLLLCSSSFQGNTFLYTHASIKECADKLKIQRVLKITQIPFGITNKRVLLLNLHSTKRPTNHHQPDSIVYSILYVRVLHETEKDGDTYSRTKGGKRTE